MTEFVNSLYESMEGVVYLLCSTTALACGILLLRGYWRNRVRLLLWCGTAFVFLGLENAILFIDLVIVPRGPDLALWRNSVALIGMCFMLYGLMLETK